MILFFALSAGGLWAEDLAVTKVKDDTVRVKGYALMNGGNPEAALALFRDGLKSFPENAALMMGAGRAAFLGGDVASSVKYLFDTIRMIPESYDANLYLGKALVRDGLDRADSDGKIAYLETETENNVGFYQALGFDVVEEITIDRLGLPLWLMARDPQ